MSTTEKTDQTTELEQLRARVGDARGGARRAGRAHRADRRRRRRSAAYWLDRWHLDLNALMRKPGAAEFRALVRAVRWVVRGHEEGQADARARLVSRVSVVIPVKDGERYLAELLDALAREGVDEVLAIDSGSQRPLARRSRARPPASSCWRSRRSEFGHGRTRNLGAERTRGELICFLTQDATPAPGWLDALRAGFALDERVGAAFGPHLPREDTSPMIARELSATSPASRARTAARRCRARATSRSCRT